MSAAGGPHDHGFDVPVLVGPALLELLLIVGAVAAVCAVGLRPFLDTTPGSLDDVLGRKAATLGAAMAGTSMLLTAGPADGMPTGALAALAVAGLALPYAVVRGERPRSRRVAEHAAPAVVVAAALAALLGHGTGALLALVVGLPWLALVRLPSPVRHRPHELEEARP